jgi:hypothetical protein
MRQVSKSQAAKNREVARIKKTKPDVCIFCGLPIRGQSDLIHILPKSTHPQYYTEPLNLWKAHRHCHQFFDDSKQYRQGQTHIIEIAKQYATKEEINRYFY